MRKTDPTADPNQTILVFHAKALTYSNIHKQQPHIEKPTNEPIEIVATPEQQEVTLGIKKRKREDGSDDGPSKKPKKHWLEFNGTMESIEAMMMQWNPENSVQKMGIDEGSSFVKEGVSAPIFLPSVPTEHLATPMKECPCVVLVEGVGTD